MAFSPPGLPHEPRERLGDLELALRRALEAKGGGGVVGGFQGKNGRKHPLLGGLEHFFDFSIIIS